MQAIEFLRPLIDKRNVGGLLRFFDKREDLAQLILVEDSEKKIPGLKEYVLDWIEGMPDAQIYAVSIENGAYVITLKVTDGAPGVSEVTTE